VYRDKICIGQSAFRLDFSGLDYLIEHSSLQCRNSHLTCFEGLHVDWSWKNTYILHRAIPYLDSLLVPHQAHIRIERERERESVCVCVCEQ
jgi:hypothetical protein